MLTEWVQVNVNGSDLDLNLCEENDCWNRFKFNQFKNKAEHEKFDNELKIETTDMSFTISAVKWS